MGYWDEALKRVTGGVQVPGFRKGKAPEKLVLERVGEITILHEAAELALRDTYLEIIKDEKIDALGRPDITITKIAKDNPLGFTIVTNVYPEIKLPNYRKIAGKVTATPLKIEEGKEGEDEATKKHRAEEKRRLEIMKAIIAEMKLELPEVMVETELNKMLAEFAHDITRMGLKFDDYLKHLKKTENELKTEWREQAIERVKFGLTLNTIAETEKVEVPTDKLEIELNLLKSHYPGADEAKMRAYVKSVLESDAVWQLLESKS